jgi:hypothetical protein
MDLSLLGAGQSPLQAPNHEIADLLSDDELVASSSPPGELDDAEIDEALDALHEGGGGGEDEDEELWENESLFEEMGDEHLNQGEFEQTNSPFVYF